MEVLRTRELRTLRTRLTDNPVVALLGPWQCGKTTLANQFAKGRSPKRVHIFDCEDPRDLAKLDNPLTVLEHLKGVVIIDEIKTPPGLLPVLRVLVERNLKQRFLTLGSASRDLITQGSETLAGRISFVELGGFALYDVGPKDLQKLRVHILTGCCPKPRNRGSNLQSTSNLSPFVKCTLILNPWLPCYSQGVVMSSTFFSTVFCRF